ncbi:Pyrimidine-specific ribonucleoside hydrolase rihA [Harpegnathos saltator]|uniref:Pyrimidine-specific ribonucleoside hydrolase rihA n=1 Tax=Harpegnathos saltator TaxID=610380 RepID=E2C2T8_HARSA|nr:Pyrimidine-specific ribonucleoside hydrolase rihA [Harpegnathos saltator]
MVNATNVIIDCDAGVDDALALYLFLVAHKHRKLRIEAVTCVYGNTDVNNVASNVLRVLELFDNYNIPVHMGAYSPLTSNKEYSRKKEDQFYGSDGFGDIDWRVNILGKVNTPFIQMLNRVEDICQLIRKGRKIGRSLDAQHYVISDAILAGIVIRPDMARNICACYADVELHGSKTRGQIVIDRGSMKKNVHLIENFDSETLKQLLLFAVNPDQKDKSVLYSQDPTNKKILNEDKNAFK